MKKILYIFLDEGGNLDFSSTGTKFFSLTSIIKMRPFIGYKELTELKYDFVENGRNIEYFHATEDKQAVRDEVFKVIRKHISKIRIDSLIVEKSKTGSALQKPERFYPKMMGYLLPHAVNHCRLEDITRIIIFTDVIPIQKKKKTLEKALKLTLAEKMPEIPYMIYHHASKSNEYLQFVDYVNWAIFRKWERGDVRSYDLIKTAIKSEFNIFRNGTIHYY